MNWTVKFERNIDDVKSTLSYDLPRDWSTLLSSLDEVDVEYHESVIAGVHKHLKNEFGGSGFMPVELIPPTEYEV